MKEFTYKICDELGIHARPAGLLVKEASDFESEIMIYKGEKSADLKRLFALMGLSVKKDDTIRVTISGSDEDAALTAIEGFFKNNL
ncbi:MAG: HPr family phosphocarrier protein [Clostridia bacterium]|nr:HPr family phosphocarrier protein [Clostridia bacterium]